MQRHRLSQYMQVNAIVAMHGNYFDIYDISCQHARIMLSLEVGGGGYTYRKVSAGTLNAYDIHVYPLFDYEIYISIKRDLDKSFVSNDKECAQYLQRKCLDYSFFVLCLRQFCPHVIHSKVNSISSLLNFTIFSQQLS